MKLNIKKNWWKILIGGALVVTGNEIVGVPILKDVFVSEPTPVESIETKTDTEPVAPIKLKVDDE